MPKPVPFIGREKELAQIDKLIRERGTLRIICISGPGGIGKTRLLQKIYQQYTQADSEYPPLKITEIVDFNDHHFHIPQNWGHRIAHMLDEETFEPYLRRLRDLRKMELAGVSYKRLDKEISILNETFITCLNTVSADQRVVLFLDTTDALTGTNVQEYVRSKVGLYIMNTGLQLKNGVVFIAGRDAKDIGNLLQATVPEAVQIIDLPPFPEQDSKAYLQEKQTLLHVTLEPELAEKLLFLAGGRPIFIDLAVEWRAREIPLKWLVKSSLEELKLLSPDQLVKRREELERQLVAHIADTRELIDWLVLVMAHIYPLNGDMMAKILDLPKSEAEVLFREAQEYVFIKSLPNGHIFLHDEVRRLVNRYVCPEVDPAQERRRRYSKLAAEHLESEVQSLLKRIDELKVEEEVTAQETDGEAALSGFIAREALEQEMWGLQVRQLGYALFADIKEGVRIFAHMFDEATRAYRLFFRERLIFEIEPLVDRLSAEQKYQFTSRQAKYLLDRPDYQHAKHIATEILNQAHILPERQVDMLILRGNAEIRLGRLEQAIADFESAVNISQKPDFKNWLVRALNARGWAYRNHGDYDRAGEDYRAAYRLSLQLNDQNQTAWILNNMGFVYGLGGKRKKAFEACQQALEIWQEIGENKGRGATYSTLGEISWRFDQLAEAMNYYGRALDIFTNENDVEWMSIVRCGQAYVFRLQGELAEADKELDWALENGPVMLEPRILHIQALIYWDKDDLESARQKLEKCNQRSVEIGDKINEYKSFVDLVELAWEFGEYDRWQEFRDQYEKLYAHREDEESLRLRGSFLRKIGDLAICDGHYDGALTAYREGLSLITRYEFHRFYTTVEQLKKTEDRVRKCSTGHILANLGRDLAQFWQDEEALFLAYPGALVVFNRWQREGDDM